MEKPVKRLINSTIILTTVACVVVAAIFLDRGYRDMLLATLIPVIVALVDLGFNMRIFKIIKLPVAKFSKTYMLNRLLKFLANIAIFLLIIFARQSNNFTIIVVYLCVFVVFFIHELVALQILTRKTKLDDA